MGAERIDLDAVQARVDAAKVDPWVAIEESAADVPALVAELREARKQREALRLALERTRDNFVAAVRGVPVRDMAETLAEVDAALTYDQQAEGVA
jgi:hypothetical protein